MGRRKLRDDFFARNPEEVARDLIGRYLFRVYRDEKIGGEIVETGAYEGGNRSGLLYDSGRIYVARFRRGSKMLVIGTDEKNKPSGVTIRKVSISDGEPIVYTPDKLCDALNIDPSLDGMSIFGKYLWIEGDGLDPSEVVRVSGEKAMSSNCLAYFRRKINLIF